MPRTALRMPKMSMTMEEGELVGWRIAVGDTVTEGQVVCEVLTDKVDMEVEAPADGTVVGIDVTEGQTVPVGTPIAWIETTSDSLMDDLFAPPSSPATTEPAPAHTPAQESAQESAQEPATTPETLDAGSTGIVPAIPGARRLAAESGLDLHDLHGTGPTGAIMISDVRAALDTRTTTTPTAARTAAPVTTPGVDTSLATFPASLPQSVHPTQSLAAGADAAFPVGVAPGPGRAPTPDDARLARLAALAPRPGEGLAAAGASLWRDAVLGHRTPPPAEELLARVAAAVGAALAESGPAGVRELPRVCLLLPTAAGSVPATLVAPHRQPFENLVADVAAALDQARSGMLDVRFLAPGDATVTWLDQVDRVSVPVRPGAVIAVGLGSAAGRVVAVGDGIGVRTTVTLSATTDVRIADPSSAAAVLARIAAALEAA